MAAILGRRADYALLLRAAGLTLLLALCLHVGFVDMIKERAFIVIMPAILWVMAGHLSETKHKFGRYLPLVAAIMPFVFISEYFKNKEEIPELLAAINSYGPACESAALYVYHRPDPPAAFYEWTSRKVLGQNGRDLSHLVDIPLVNTTCPVLAAAVLLPKNNQDMIGTATEFMTRKGYAAEDIEIKTFGKGRSVVWIDKRLDQSPLK